MGRVKIAMEFIKKEKARNNTFIKRKKGLLKKSYEISILCDVPVCIIIYPYKEGKPQQQQQQAEVYSFKGGAETGLICPNDDDLSSNEAIRDPKGAWEIIDRYLRVPIEERNKKSKCVTLYDMFDDWTKKADQELTKIRHKNALAKYPSCISNINEFSVDQLMELLVHLDQKIEVVNQRIDTIKGIGNHNQEVMEAATATTTTGLVPYFEPTLPISNFMNPRENNGHYQMGYPEFEGINQFPLFDYSIINNNNNDDPTNNQEYYHQIVPFNSQNALFPHHQVVGATKMEDHGRSGNNLVMYNMMGGVGPMYYDQRSGIVDNVGATSSYGGGSGGFPISMPLQLPMLQQPNNVSLPRQRQYQIFYK